MALLLSNLREVAAPIKRIENQASGVVPVMKILEDSFPTPTSLALGRGAGAVYLHAHRPDIHVSLLPTLSARTPTRRSASRPYSLGVVIPDVTFQLTNDNRDMHLFSPYDVQHEYGTHVVRPVGEPTTMTSSWRTRGFERTRSAPESSSRPSPSSNSSPDTPTCSSKNTVNRANPLAGHINMSNLCSEILQTNTPSTYDSAIGTRKSAKTPPAHLGFHSTSLRP